MAKKTVVKNTLSKYGPLSIEMAKAIESDQKGYNPSTNTMEYVDNDQVPQQIVEKPEKGIKGLKSFIDASETTVDENTQQINQNTSEIKETANASESESTEVIDNDKIPF